MKQKVFTNCFLVKMDEDGKPRQVCLGMKKRGFGQGMWNGSGGKPNENETMEAAALREIEEEFGVRVRKIEKRGEISFELRQEEKLVLMHTFLATEWEGEPTKSEEMKPEWFDVEAIPYNQMWQSDHEWLPLILSGQRIEAHFTYLCEGGEVESRSITELTDWSSKERLINS